MNTLYLGSVDYNYSAVTALTLSVWDICITIDDEIEQIWSRPWNGLKSLHVFLRSFSVIAQAIVVTISIKLTATGFTMSPRHCLAFLGFQGIASQVLEVVLQYILILRLSALYSTNVNLRRGLRIAFVLEIVLMVIAFATQFPKMIVASSECMVQSFPVVGVVGYYMLPLLFDLVCFVLTMIKFYQSSREGWCEGHIMSRFMQDGIWVFALPFVALLSNILCMALFQNFLSTVAFAWLIAIPGFAGPRLILNMSHLLGHRSYAGMDTPDDAGSVSLPVWRLSEVQTYDERLAQPP